MKILNKKIALIALAATLLCGFAANGEAAFHGPGAPAPAPGQGNFGAPCPAFGPGLSPEQMQQAQQIFNESFASMDGTRQTLAAKRAELNALLASPNPDKGQIERLSTEIGQLRGKMLAARADVRAKLQQQGLPADFYGPGAPRGGNFGPNPGWGCPGMMMWDNGPQGWNDGPRGGWHHGPRHGGRGHGHGGCGW